MTLSFKKLALKKWRSQIDWKLLILLLLFLNVKLAIKVPAIVLIYLLQPNFGFGFKLKQSRLPLFYPFIIGIAFLGLIVNKSYQNPNYFWLLLTGTCFWLLCILAIHQVKLSIEKRNTIVIHQTLVFFFIINALFSALNLLKIIWEIGAINPYIYQGLYQKYFMGTGDYIKGVTFDTSTTNAIINAIGVIYFLMKKQYPMLLLCMLVLIFTGSNFCNMILLVILAGLFVFNSTREQKSMMVICTLLLVVFMVKISPQNNKYVNETFQRIFAENWKTNLNKPQINPIPIVYRPDSVLNTTERKEKFATLYLDSLSNLNKPKAPRIASTTVDTIIKNTNGRILLPQDNIHSATFQSIKVPLKAQEPMLVFIDQHSDLLPYSAKRIVIPALPGKMVGLLQSFSFFKRFPQKIFVGNGMGNFSSKLAYRTSSLGITGNYPKKYSYINKDFMMNHLDVYLYFFSKQSGFHSVANSPFSGYDQLLTEYGLLGVVVFFVFYLGYFLKSYRKLTYGIPILILMSSIFLIDYWYEQLSVIIIFELVLLLNIAELTPKKLKGIVNE
jgi:hypothetical protein